MAGTASQLQAAFDAIQQGTFGACATHLLSMRNDQTENGTHLLNWAAHHGNVKAAEWLLKAGVDVNCSNSGGSYPLLVALVHPAVGSHGHMECFKLLLAANAAVDQANTSNGDTRCW